MARTLSLYTVSVFVVSGFWLRIEHPRIEEGKVFLIALLALAPALVRGLRSRLLALLAAALVAARIAFDLPFHGYLGALGDRFGNGLLDYYDYRLPFDPRLHAGMHGVLLAAVFGFCVALALAIAARRAGLAVALLLVGAGWPVTLLAGGRTTFYGTVILAAALTLLAGLARRPSLQLALPLAATIVLVGVAASGTAAVANRQLLNWQRWDFYTRPQTPVSVRYVWNYNYDGLRFPKKVTTVLKVKAPPTSLYWRATTLDDFDGNGWVEDATYARTRFDPLLPAAARNPKKWVQADVTIEALRDFHLVGASVPVAYDTGELPVVHETDGIAIVPRGLVRGESYRVWSYAPQPKPAQLVALPAEYPRSLRRFLEVAPGIVVPPLGTPGRAQLMSRLFATHALDGTVGPYEVLYRRARALTHNTRSPYLAALEIETWLRQTGGFAYDTRPPVAGAAPPLVTFVALTRAGYCQHFAGAMALMLRYRGIPARVAAGFVSGAYDGKHHEWTISDHDAHTWVEVWFPRYGWLPFDPTPGRGSLSASYTVSSRSYDPKAVLAALERNLNPFESHRFGSFEKQAAAFGHTGGDVPRGGRPLALPADHSVRNLFRLLGVVLVGVLALIALVKLVLRRARFLTRDPRRVAGACRRELADFLVDQRIDVPRSATLHELGARVDEALGVDARAFVAAATAARFGPVERAGAAAAAAREELRRLERGMRAQLDRLDRTRGLFSLRSLGFS